MNEITINTDYLRDIILGHVQFRKCPACDNAGREYWDETGTAVLPYPHPDWGDNYESGPCEYCNGLGYIPFQK